MITSYTGDLNYAGKEVRSNVSVKSMHIIDVSIPDDVVPGENTTVTVDLPDDASGNVTVVIDGKNYTAPVVNGSASVNVTLPDGAGVHNITVDYSGDDKYPGDVIDTTFNVPKISDYDMNIDVPVDLHPGDKATIVVDLPEDATGKVTVQVGDNVYEAVVKDGKAVITTDELPYGDYEVITTYTGDLNYAGKEVKSNVSVRVHDYDVNITIPDIKPGENTTINVDLPDDASGNVTVTIDGKNYTGEVINGSVNITIPPVGPGDHEVIINYTGDGKYAPVVKNETISGFGLILDVDDIVMFYKDGTRFGALLTDYLGNPIANATLTFTVNGISYTRTTDAKGYASLALNLVPGVYNASVSYTGSKGNVSKDITITINSTIVGSDIVKMYQNGTQFYATFYGKDGKVLANTEVSFNINGVFYKRSTDKDGVAKLNINLNPGNYTLTAINPFNGEQKGFNVLVKSLIETNDLTKYYRNASQFEAKIYNKDGSLAVNKEVSFNINGVFYKRTSDANGIVKLSINLRPGDYIITTMYEGLSIGNNVKVLPTLETSDLSMSYRDGSKFSAKTLDDQGNPLANQDVTFNVNGVFYHRMTGNDGIALLNINLMSGEYIITSYWNDFQTGNKISIK